MRRIARRDDRGSAVLDVAVVAPLLLLVALGVVQVGLAVYVRSTLASAAAEGARVSAVSGGDTAIGVRRTRSALDASIADGVVDSVVARTSVVGGMPVVDVEVHARLPLVGLLGPSVLVVHGHALAEP
jgi:Flp pilus assembly protein TadG